ncbi:MAG TPA: hypothetical protein VGK77_14915, partial [Candidatus Binatia bacterium]
TRTTTVISGAVAVEGRRRFDADLYGFRVGPYVEFPLNERLTVSFNGGLALAQVESDFKFNELVTITGSGTVNNVGSGSKDDLLAGFYVGGIFSYALNEKWTLVGTAQFQDVGRYAHREGGKKAVLDLTEAIFASFGASYSF